MTLHFAVIFFHFFIGFMTTLHHDHLIMALTGAGNSHRDHLCEKNHLTCETRLFMRAWTFFWFPVQFLWSLGLLLRTPTYFEFDISCVFCSLAVSLSFPPSVSVLVFLSSNVPMSLFSYLIWVFLPPYLAYLPNFRFLSFLLDVWLFWHMLNAFRYALLPQRTRGSIHLL